jgi:hypothetical protein
MYDHELLRAMSRHISEVNIYKRETKGRCHNARRMARQDEREREILEKLPKDALMSVEWKEKVQVRNGE